MALYFFIISVILIISSIFAIVSKNIIHSVLLSMVTFLMIGCMFALLDATYNALVQFLVYVTTIPILMIVSILFLTNKSVNKIFNLKCMLISLIGISVFTLIIGKYLNLNTDFFLQYLNCKSIGNNFSDLVSISQNILDRYKVLFLEVGFVILSIIVGVKYNEK